MTISDHLTAGEHRRLRLDTARNWIAAATLVFAATTAAFAGLAIWQSNAFFEDEQLRAALIARTANCLELAKYHQAVGDPRWSSYAANKGRLLALCGTPYHGQATDGDSTKNETAAQCVSRRDVDDVNGRMSDPSRNELEGAGLGDGNVMC